METDDRIRRIVEETLDGSGIELVSAHLSGPERDRAVSLTVDKPGGITVDECADVSRLVSQALDDEDPIPGSYRLNVASPGAERTLVEPSDFRLAVGRLVRVDASDDVHAEGRLRDVDDDRIVLAADGDEVEIPLDRVQVARTVLDWRPNRGKDRTKDRTKDRKARRRERAPRRGGERPSAEGRL